MKIYRCDICGRPDTHCVCGYSKVKRCGDCGHETEDCVCDERYEQSREEE